jgi:hypothetical protein
VDGRVAPEGLVDEFPDREVDLHWMRRAGASWSRRVIGAVLSATHERISVSGSEYVDFSPTEEFRHVIEHIPAGA